MSNDVKVMSKCVNEYGLTQEAPYVKEYVKDLTYRLAQVRMEVRMRAGGKMRVEIKGGERVMLIIF